jgi:UTP--glucose-1-phosphate uridylyltransferase
MMKSFIRKAVFPVAGMGIRFLPATKASPKEMMPIVDKPLIQYAVEEAIEAGIKEMIFVTSSSKRAIEDHFDCNFELEAKLNRLGKEELLEMVHNILPKGISCVYIRQPEALGLGHAILCAKNIVGNEPFAILLADDLIEGEADACLKQMAKKFETIAASMVAIEKIAPKDSEKYGVIGFAHDSEEIEKREALEKINKIVEKPSSSEAPSSFGVVGRYILTPSIFPILEKILPGRGGEIQLTDAISQLLQKESVYAYQFRGTRFDCGSKLGYLQAIISFGLKHAEIGDAFKEYLDQKGSGPKTG